MTFYEGLMILAVAAGPIVAVQVSQYIERVRENRDRKLNVFRILMSTRAATLDAEHVGALNSIDVEFSGESKPCKRVIEAWKVYLDHLNTDASQGGWGSKREELFVELLQRMADCLGYDFDKSHLRNTAYFPTGYGEVYADQYAIRKAMVAWTKGESSFPVEIRMPTSMATTPPPETTPEHDDDPTQ